MCVLTGYCTFESLLGQRVPNITGSFKLDRQETGATEVCVSSLDIVRSNNITGSFKLDRQETGVTEVHVSSLVQAGSSFYSLLSSGHIVL